MMKKLVVLLLILWGVGPILKKKAIERWWPEETSEYRDRQWEVRQNLVRMEQERQRQRAWDREQADKRLEEWRERDRQRVERLNVDPDKVAKGLRNYGGCAAAQNNLAAVSIVEKLPGTFELKQGGKVLTEAERAAARAKNEKLMEENCRP